MNLTGCPFQKGHRREMRKEGKSLLYLWPLSGAKTDNELGGRRHFPPAEAISSGESCWDSKATQGSWCLQGPGGAQAVKFLCLAQMVIFHVIHHLF